jgi:hypothetical protein
VIYEILQAQNQEVKEHTTIENSAPLLLLQTAGLPSCVPPLLLPELQQQVLCLCGQARCLLEILQAQSRNQAIDHTPFQHDGTTPEDLHAQDDSSAPPLNFLQQLIVCITKQASKAYACSIYGLRLQHATHRMENASALAAAHKRAAL